MKNKNQQSQFDLFTPIYEIFHELCVMTFDVLKEVFIFAYKKLLNKAPPLKKIERKALNVKKYTQAQEALGIDTDTRKDFWMKEIDFKRHSFIVGASGFGKTNLMTILQENSLRDKKPVIFFDPKGDSDALQTFKKLCDSYNRPCYIFSEHYEGSISMNPLLEGTVNQVSDRIMRAFEWENKYYEDISRRSLSQVLQKLEKDDIPFTFKAIFDGLVQIETKDNIGIITKIESILTSDFGKILNGKEDALTISKIREEGACLYIGLSTQGYGETAMAVGKILLGELLFHSYKTLSNSENPKAGLENPISVQFDEFGSLVTPNFIELQNKCRGAGIELTVAVQTASDIDRVNPDLTRQIIENSGNIFVMKQRLAESAQLFAESIGTVLAKKQTYRIEDGQKQSLGSEREAHELIVHSDIIKNLNIGQCVLLRQGPTRVNLINVRERKWDSMINHQRSKQKIPSIL